MRDVQFVNDTENRLKYAKAVHGLVKEILRREKIIIYKNTINYEQRSQLPIDSRYLPKRDTKEYYSILRLNESGQEVADDPEIMSVYTEVMMLEEKYRKSFYSNMLKYYNLTEEEWNQYDYRKQNVWASIYKAANPSPKGIFDSLVHKYGRLLEKNSSRPESTVKKP